MNCELLQNRLLALPDPRRVPQELQGHLTSCPACREWLRALLRVDGALARLPVPAPSPGAKAAVLERFRTRPARAPEPQAEPRRFRLRALWPAAAIAATSLVGVLAWMNLNGPRDAVAQTPADPMLADAMKFRTALEAARSPDERVRVFLDWADSLQSNMQTWARVDTGENLADAAKMYAKVVREGVIGQAKDVSDPQRKAVKEAADRLAEAYQKAERLAQEVPPASVAPLQEVAAAAREGDRQLRLLLQRGA